MDKVLTKVELMAAYTYSSQFNVKVNYEEGYTASYSYTFTDTESYVGYDIDPSKGTKPIVFISNAKTTKAYLKKVRLTFADDNEPVAPEIDLADYFIGSTQATLSLPDGNSDAIYYTTNDEATTDEFTLYTGPIDIDCSCKIRAFSRTDDKDSDIAEASTIKVIAPIASPGHITNEYCFDSSELNVTLCYDTSNDTIDNDRFIICYSLNGDEPTCNNTLLSGDNISINYSAGRQTLKLRIYDNKTETYTDTNTYTYTPVAENLTNLVPTDSPIHFNKSLLAKFKINNEIYVCDEASMKSMLIIDNADYTGTIASGSYISDFDFIYISGSDDDVPQMKLMSSPTISTETSTWNVEELKAPLTDDDYAKAVYVYGTITEYTASSEEQPATVRVTYGNNYELLALNHFNTQSTSNVELRFSSSDFKWCINDDWPEETDLLNKNIYLGGLVGKYQQSPVLYLVSMSEDEGILTDVDLISTEEKIVDVYNICGTRIRQGIELNKASIGLPHGFYIINGHKILIK